MRYIYKYQRYYHQAQENHLLPLSQAAHLILVIQEARLHHHHLGLPFHQGTHYSQYDPSLHQDLNICGTIKQIS